LTISNITWPQIYRVFFGLWFWGKFGQWDASKQGNHSVAADKELHGSHSICFMFKKKRGKIVGIIDMPKK